MPTATLSPSTVGRRRAAARIARFRPIKAFRRVGVRRATLGLLFSLKGGTRQFDRRLKNPRERLLPQASPRTVRRCPLEPLQRRTTNAQKVHVHKKIINRALDALAVAILVG